MTNKKDISLIEDEEITCTAEIAIFASFYSVALVKEGSAFAVCGFIQSSLHRVEAHGRLRVADAPVAEHVVRVVEDELLREDIVEVPEKCKSLSSPANF